MTSALGAGVTAHLQALRERRSGVRPMPWETASDLPTCLGEVAGVDELSWPADLAAFDCRNNRLAWMALQQDGFDQALRQAVERWLYGAHARLRSLPPLSGSASLPVRRDHAFARSTAELEAGTQNRMRWQAVYDEVRRRHAGGRGEATP